MTLTLMEKLRLDKRMSRDDLHSRSGVPLRTIRELESGRVKWPKQETVQPIADALRVKPSMLMEDFRRHPDVTARTA